MWALGTHRQVYIDDEQNDGACDFFFTIFALFFFGWTHLHRYLDTSRACFVYRVLCSALNFNFDEDMYVIFWAGSGACEESSLSTDCRSAAKPKGKNTLRVSTYSCDVVGITSCNP